MSDYKSSNQQEQPDQNINDECVEYIVGEKLIRYLTTDKHEPQVIFGWSFSLLVFYDAVRLGVSEIVVVDRSDLKIYSVSMNTFCTYCRLMPVNREFYLAVEHWIINENPQPALVIDATFTNHDSGQGDGHKGDSLNG